MLSKADKYIQMIQDGTQKIMLFHHMDNKGNKSTFALQCNIKLPSSHPFGSSQQIEKNTSITHQITNQSSKQYPTALYNQWPQSCIGLVLCEHHQNNQTFYVYGTGMLIYNNIVLTSAQNVYCRRLNTQYTNIRFIVGVNGDKCGGIYDVMSVDYPKEYTMQEEYQNYNFAVIQLYDDLSKSCGYVGWKTVEDRKEVQKYIEYGYIIGNQQGTFKLRQTIKNDKSQQEQCCSGSGVLVKQNDEFYIVGIYNPAKSEGLIILNDKIKSIINQWTHYTIIDLADKNIGAQGCKYLSQANYSHLKQINLWGNNIDTQGCKYLSQTKTHLTTIHLGLNLISAQGCKYLSQADWPHLTSIRLNTNDIDAQGCKYLSQSNWTHLTRINLNFNKISAQGCKYMSQANWAHLTQIFLSKNNINAQGCKYLSQANWIHLTYISMATNNIDTQGCKYLNQANWTHLIWIDLDKNIITAQSCKYLSQANWTHLTYITLRQNKIDAQGCKYLSRANWTHLTRIDLDNNAIKTQGCKYLSQTNWVHSAYINLTNNYIEVIISRLLLLQLYPNAQYQIIQATDSQYEQQYDQYDQSDQHDQDDQ